MDKRRALSFSPSTAAVSSLRLKLSKVTPNLYVMSPTANSPKPCLYCRENIRKNAQFLVCRRCKQSLHIKCHGLSDKAFVCHFCFPNAGKILDIETRLTDLEDRMLKLEEEIGSLSSPSVTTNLQELVNESNDQEHRRANLVIFGLAEDHQFSDLDSFVNMCSDELGERSTDLAASIDYVKRLGSSNSDKPKLLLIPFYDLPLRARIVKNAKNLRSSSVESFNSVYIKPDLTKRQQARNRDLVKEL